MADQFITDVTKLSKDAQATLTANAKSQGITVEEYLQSRGGVNPVTKKYGDSYNPNIDLNDAEYQAAVSGAGPKIGDAGAALNAAREKKLQAYIKANPDSPEALRYGMEGRAEAKSNAAKTVTSVVKQSDGSSIVTYSDGTTATLPAGAAVPTVGSSAAGTASNTSEAATQAAKDKAERQSAYDLLYLEFKQYGLEALVEPFKSLIIDGVSKDEFKLRLRESEAYKKRFAGNTARVAKGLAAISEAEYIGLEDQYQNIMRNYGLPASYWSKDSMGTQAGFTNFIGNDVSATELEDRIMTAQKRVINSNPQVSEALKQFYPEITNGDILAYTLDPTQGLDVIKRKISAAEIGGAALAQGLNTGVTRAEELAKYGVTKDQAMQGYGAIGGGLQRGSQLASIYGQDPYSQTTAETEVFGLAGTQDAANQRKKITGLEKAAFSGQTGISSGALVRDRAGGY
jgi:hypothetical protein